MSSEGELPGKHPATLVTPQHCLVRGAVVVFGEGYEGEGVTETPAALSACIHSAVWKGDIIIGFIRADV